jgi:hypothetical protein
MFIFNNEDAKFDRWYKKMKKNEFDEEVSNRDRRIETMPIIQEQLRALSYINGPDSTGHAAVYEFHNGHSNPAGLGFQFAEMTAEEFGVVQHTAIQDTHQKLPLGLLQLPHLLRTAKDNLWYGNKEEDDLTAGQVIFTLEELEEAKDYPTEKDLILNKNGSFFKVVSVNSLEDKIIANRLTVSGVGGGGGSGSSFIIDGDRVGLRNRYVPISSSNINLTFIAATTSGPDMALYANIIFKDSTGLA